MAQLEIKIIKRTAHVRITKKLFEKRMHGLIQYISYFCKDNKWRCEDCLEYLDEIVNDMGVLKED